MSATISTKKQCSVRLYLQLFVWGLMSYLRYLCLLVYSVVQHILCFCFVLLHLVYPMLPFSLYCPFLIALSVLYNVYLLITKQGQLKVEYMGQTYTISYKLPSDRLSLFRRSVNRWRVSAPARTLQLFTYRLNNHSRSRELITFLYDVADL
jgi:hypothetical protein